MKLTKKMLIIATVSVLSLSCDKTFAYSSLSNAITANVTEKIYDIETDITTNLGAMKGSILTVNGNNNSITVNSGKKLTIAKDKTLILNNIGQADVLKDSLGNITSVDVKSSFSGAPNSAITVTSGNLEINNSVFSNNAQVITAKSSTVSGVVNPSTINVNNSIFYNNTVTASGASNSGAVFTNVASTIENLSGLFMENKTNFSNKQIHGVSLWNTGTVKNLSADFVKNVGTATNSFVDGSAIYNFGKIENVTSDFIENGSVGTGSSNNSVTGAVYNKGTISSIDSKFVGNYSLADGHQVTGGAISNNGTIESISGEFYKNYVSTKGHSAIGGAIFNFNNAHIDTIKADFIGNYVKTENTTFSYGGALANYGKINEIQGLFKDNYIDSKSGETAGGALYNWDGNATIKNLNADFINNKIFSYSSDVYEAYGGALLNEGTIENIEGNFNGNSITLSHDPDSLNPVEGGAVGGALANYGSIYNIKGKFSDNYIKGNDYNYANGGAIFNAADLNTIEADFENNYTISDTDVASGGAIYNQEYGGFIGIIKGRFTGNSSISGAEGAKGGAIRNEKASFIGAIQADFDENISYQSGNNDFGYSKGGAIYNNSGIIANVSGNFTNNLAISNAISEDVNLGDGGAVYNEAGVITFIDSSFSNNAATNSGGAIFNKGIVNIISDTKDVVFSNNVVGNITK